MEVTDGEWLVTEAAISFECVAINATIFFWSKIIFRVILAVPIARLSPLRKILGSGPNLLPQQNLSHRSRGVERKFLTKWSMVINDHVRPIQTGHCYFPITLSTVFHFFFFIYPRKKKEKILGSTILYLSQFWICSVWPMFSFRVLHQAWKQVSHYQNSYCSCYLIVLSETIHESFIFAWEANPYQSRLYRWEINRLKNIRSKTNYFDCHR